MEEAELDAEAEQLEASCDLQAALEAELELQGLCAVSGTKDAAGIRRSRSAQLRRKASAASLRAAADVVRDVTAAAASAPAAPAPASAPAGAGAGGKPRSRRRGGRRKEKRETKAIARDRTFKELATTLSVLGISTDRPQALGGALPGITIAEKAGSACSPGWGTPSFPDFSSAGTPRAPDASGAPRSGPRAADAATAAAAAAAAGSGAAAAAGAMGPPPPRPAASHGSASPAWSTASGPDLAAAAAALGAGVGGSAAGASGSGSAWGGGGVAAHARSPSEGIPTGRGFTPGSGGKGDDASEDLGTRLRSKSAKSLVGQGEKAGAAAAATARRQQSSPFPRHRRTSSGGLGSPMHFGALGSEHSLDELHLKRTRWRESLQTALGAVMTADDLRAELQEAASKAADLVAEIREQAEANSSGPGGGDAGSGSSSSGGGGAGGYSAAAGAAAAPAGPGGWRGLEDAVTYLEDAFRRGRDATRGLRGHGELLASCGLSGELSAIVSDLQPALVELATATAARVAGALSAAGASGAAARRWGEEDCRRAHRLARRTVDALREADASATHSASRHAALRPAAAPAHAALRAAALSVFESACDAATGLQAALLTPASVAADPGVPLHSISATGKAVVLMWRAAVDLGYNRVAKVFESLKLAVGQRLVTMFGDAAAAAAEMLSTGDADAGDSSDEDEALAPHPSSAWCAPAPTGPDAAPPPGDAAVLAHGWVPAVLSALQTAASGALRRLEDDLAVRDRDAAAQIPAYPEISEEDEEALAAATQSLLDSFFLLALATTRRVARLCAAPGALAIWALESLREQAEAALRFVAEYNNDRNPLGLGRFMDSCEDDDEAAELFAQLVRTTNRVSNLYLAVKRHLKVRVFHAEGEGGGDPPGPTAAPGPSQQQQQPSRSSGGGSSGSGGAAAAGPGTGGRRPLASAAVTSATGGRPAVASGGGAAPIRAPPGRRLGGGVPRTGSSQSLASGGGSRRSSIDHGPGPSRLGGAGPSGGHAPAAAAAAAAAGSGRELHPGRRSLSFRHLAGSGGEQQQASPRQPARASIDLQQGRGAAAAGGGGGYAYAAAAATAAEQVPLLSPARSPLGAPQAPPALSPVGTGLLGPTPSGSPLLPALNPQQMAPPGAAGLPSLPWWAGGGGGGGGAPASPLAGGSSGGGAAAGPAWQLPPSAAAAANPLSAVDLAERAIAAALAPHNLPRPLAPIVTVPVAAAPARSPSPSPPPHHHQQQQRRDSPPPPPRPTSPFMAAALGSGGGANGDSEQQQRRPGGRESFSPPPAARPGAASPFTAASAPPFSPPPPAISAIGLSIPTGGTAPLAVPGAGTGSRAPSLTAPVGSYDAWLAPNGGGRESFAGRPLTSPDKKQQEQQQGAPSFAQVLARSRQQPQHPAPPLAQQQRPPQQQQQSVFAPQEQQPAANNNQHQQQQHAGLSPASTAPSTPGSARARASPFLCNTTASAAVAPAAAGGSGSGGGAGSEGLSSAAATPTAAAAAAGVQLQRRPDAGAPAAAASAAAADAGGAAAAPLRDPREVAAAVGLPPAAAALLRIMASSEDAFWAIRWRDLEPGLVRKLGSGGFGQVWQGVYLNADVAIKILNVDYDDPGSFSFETLVRFKSEVDYQRKLSFHPNVVRFIGACCELPDGLSAAMEARAAAAAATAAARAGGAAAGVLAPPPPPPPPPIPPGLVQGVKLAIVMELCRLGSVFSMISQARRVGGELAADPACEPEVRRRFPYGAQFYNDWVTRLEVAHGAAAGVQFMHEMGVVHRDLTSYNVLLDFGRPWQVKVCDFNLSRVVADEAQLANSGNPNSPGWQSPEMLAGKCYGKAADVFSFGVVLWELITLKQPWRDETEGRAALYFIMSEVIAGNRLAMPTPEEVSPPLPEAAEVIALAEACWEQRPEARPTMAQVAGRLRGIINAVKARRREEQQRRLLGGAGGSSGGGGGGGSGNA